MTPKLRYGLEHPRGGRAATCHRANHRTLLAGLRDLEGEGAARVLGVPPARRNPVFKDLLNAAMITAAVIFGYGVFIIDDEISRPIAVQAETVKSPDGFTADHSTCAPATQPSPFRV